VAEKVAALSVSVAAGDLTLALRGRLDATGAGVVWEPALEALEGASGALIVDASGVEYCDMAGVGLLVELEARQRRRSAPFSLRGASPEVTALRALVPAELFEPAVAVDPRASWPEQVGRVAVAVRDDVVGLVGFVGALTMELCAMLRWPRRLRFSETLLTIERAGADALPIVAMIGFLIGLILAFQSAIPLKRFGAEIFVANLVGLSLLRELGPFVTAIIMAGRSGSAFAAEIGTMKVNEEINALETMGLDPMRFLVLPKVVAATLVLPMLTLFFEICGLIGGGVVMLQLGFPPIAYLNQLLFSLEIGDFLGGLFKALVFGVLVAGIGCQRGLETGTGASAVGESTTRSVVSGIVLIAVFDAGLSVLFFSVGV